MRFFLHADKFALSRLMQGNENGIGEQQVN